MCGDVVGREFGGEGCQIVADGVRDMQVGKELKGGLTAPAAFVIDQGFRTVLSEGCDEGAEAVLPSQCSSLRGRFGEELTDRDVAVEKTWVCRHGVPLFYELGGKLCGDIDGARIVSVGEKRIEVRHETGVTGVDNE